MRRLLLVLILSLASLLPASPALAAGPEFEQQVVQLVNQLRQDAGLAPLATSTELTTSARRYADHMATARFFGHQGPDGSTLVTRDEAAGYVGWSFLAENLAAGHSDPQTVVRAWMASPSHRANVLSSRAREIGVGYVYRPGSPYAHYWAQEFGTRPGDSRLTTQPAAGSDRSSASRQRVLAALAEPASPAQPPSELRDAHGSLDTLGNARSKVVLDPASGQWVQYYQRAVLEWHPENPPAYRVQRRLLGDLLYPGAEPPVPPSDAPPGPYHYFALSADAPTGLGHFVADLTRDGQPVYFMEFFDAHGGVQTLGYPKEEPRLRDGRWTQRFQAAVLEYHPEFDRDGHLPGTDIPYRTYRVQLELLGDRYLDLNGAPTGS